MNLLLGVVAALQLVLVGLVVLLARRRPLEIAPLLGRLENLERLADRSDRTLREEAARGREEATRGARHAREELATRLERLTDNTDQKLSAVRETIEERLDHLTVRSEERLETLRAVVDDRLRKIQEDNGQQLDKMRATVDEKLQGTLEKRLGESFKQVSDRLEQVHKGLGEMQTLAVGVGDLKRVLTNVKTRGGWGEVQLGALLDQVLAPEQYERNVKLRDDSDDLVEFAVRLPGHDDGPLFLPIDAKFPTESYQRLVQAQEAADATAAEEASKQLDRAIRNCARDIFTKYVNPPRTADFAIMFLPTEGLYAEVIRHVELVEVVQRECHVLIAGPTNLVALLNSLQMGFRTLAVQKRSSEVWQLLGAVKTEFGKFGDVLDGVRKKLDQAAKTMDDAGRRSRAIERKLRDVEVLPTADAPLLIEAGGYREVEPALDEMF